MLTPPASKREKKKGGRFLNRSVFIYVLVTFTFIGLSCAIFLHSNGLHTLAWQRKPITGFTPEIGHTFLAPLGLEWMSSHEGPSPANALEDGMPLGPGNAQHEDIRKLGMGRFSFWHDTLYFSSSDNTDPRKNGRSYEVYWPMPVSPFIRWGMYLLSFASVVTLLTTIYRKKAGLQEMALPIWQTGIRFVSGRKTIFIGSCALLIIPFVLTRLPFFLYYPVAGLNPDYGGYYGAVWEMGKGIWPNFGARTPGYPLFLKFMFTLSDKNMTVVIAQNIITLVSSLAMIFSIFSISRYLAPLAALAITAFVTSSTHVQLDVSLLSESLYVNTLILAFACFIPAIYFRKPLLFALSSFFMAFSIYVRPTALFFIVSFVMIVIYLVYNRFSKKNVISFIMPFMLLMFLLPLYNFLNIHYFGISNFGSFTIMMTTSTFLEQNSGYPDELNAAIEKIQNRLTPEDREVIFHSWNPVKLYKAFSRYWGNSGVTIPLSDSKIRETYDYPTLYRMLYRDAIRKHPDVYLRVFFSNFAYYFFANTRVDVNLYTNTEYMYKILFIDKSYASNLVENFRRELLREYYDPAPLPYFEIAWRDNIEYATVVPTTLQKIHIIYARLHNKFFKNMFWSFCFFGCMLASSIVLIHTRFRHPGALILFIMTTGTLGAGIIICLANLAILRYSYTMEFVYYLGIALLPLMMCKPDAHSSRKATEQ